MLLSKPEISGTVKDSPGIAQHYIVCASEICNNNCQLHCNLCHQPVCEQCKNDHQNNPETKSREMFPYPPAKRKLPEEKCKEQRHRYDL